jgi:hypothetical protein
MAVLDGDKGVDRLACELIGDTDDGGLGDGGVLDQCRLNLGRRQTVAADVDDVVDTAADPVEALVVAARAVSSELHVT